MIIQIIIILIHKTYFKINFRKLKGLSLTGVIQIFKWNCI